VEGDPSERRRSRGEHRRSAGPQVFTADHGKGSNCAGDCATAWPPYTVKKQPLAGPGAESGSNTR